MSSDRVPSAGENPPDVAPSDATMEEAADIDREEEQSTENNQPAHTHTATLLDSIDADGDDDDENDSDWGEEDGEGDGEGDDEDPTGATDAARIFSHILRELGGDTAGASVNTSNIHQILEGLAAQGLLHRDEDGNIVMIANDDDDEEEEGEDGDVYIESADEGDGDDDAADVDGASEVDPSAPLPIQKDDDGLRDYAAYTRLDRIHPVNLLRSIESSHHSYHTRPAAPASQLSALSARHIPNLCTSVEEFDGRAFCGKFSHRVILLRVVSRPPLRMALFIYLRRRIGSGIRRSLPARSAGRSSISTSRPTLVSSSIRVGLIMCT